MPKSFGKLDLIYATRVEYFPEWKGYTSALEWTEKEYWGMISNVITQTGVAAMKYCMKVSKRHWYCLGGFSNPDLFRRMKQGAWEYWESFR